MRYVCFLVITSFSWSLIAGNENKGAYKSGSYTIALKRNLDFRHGTNPYMVAYPKGNQSVRDAKDQTSDCNNHKYALGNEHYTRNPNRYFPKEQRKKSKKGSLNQQPLAPRGKNSQDSNKHESNNTDNETTPSNDKGLNLDAATVIAQMTKQQLREYKKRQKLKRRTDQDKKNGEQMWPQG